MRSAVAWRAELVLRMRRHLALKLVGTTLFIWAFFIGYFHVLRHPVYPPTTMPLTRLDGAIAAQPLAIFPYLSLWFYVGIAPGLQRSFRALLAYAGWSAALCGIGLAIFYRWPTRIPSLVFDTGDTPGFALLHGIDAPGNACPSLHVAIAMFTAIRIAALLRECRTPLFLQVVNATWFAAIAWSTIAIRQHVVIDAVAGAALGIVVALPSLHYRRRAGDPRPRGPL
jgi:membrane-associated phospholipid phosphatase